MEGTNRRFDPRLLVGALALVLVVAAIWAGTALAAGGSSSSSSGSTATDSPAVEYVQDDGEAPAAEDCPERGGSSSASEESASNL